MPSSEQRRLAERGAAQYLERLLRDPGLPYRKKWLRRNKNLKQTVPLNDPNVLKQESVAAVLDTFIFNNQLVKFTDVQLRQYQEGDRPVFFKQTSRALNGHLSKTMLTYFIGAFGITEEHERRLWAIWNGEAYAPIVIGDLERPESLPAHGHETILVHEHHRIGADGMPIWQETRQTIRSHVDNLTYFPYRFDTNKVDVSLQFGGTQGAMRQHAENLWEVPFYFHQSLKLGQELNFCYQLDFRYEDPPPLNYQRRIYNRYEGGWDLRVSFHEDRLPRRVWWAEWATDQEDSPVKHEELVPLDHDRSVHRHLMSIERAVAGFRWEW